MRALVPLALFLSMLASCSSSPTGLNEVTGIGILRFLDLPVVVEVPQFAAINESVPLRFTTFGSECLRMGTVTVHQEDASVEVTPVDTYIHDSAFPCADIIKTNEYHVDLEFGTPGNKLITIVGRTVDIGQVRDTIIERQLLVD